jgi:hypothetical protein
MEMMRAGAGAAGAPALIISHTRHENPLRGALPVRPPESTLFVKHLLELINLQRAAHTSTVEVWMKRERAVQVVLTLVGLLYLAWAIPLFQSLWHSSWFQQHQDAFPMFMSVNTVLGVFLLLAVKHPAKHRSLIAFAGWSTIAHAFTMAIMSLEAWSYGTHRKDSPQDIVIVAAIGVLLLAVLPAKEPGPARTESAHSARMSVQAKPAEA